MQINGPINEDQARLAGALGDDYQVISTIGSGGCGTVYKVLLKSLDRIVAVKAIRGETDASALRRLHSEAQALADLKHTNIVEVLHFGVHDDCGALVMEFVDGRNLDSEIEKNGPLPAQRCRPLMAQCASALEAAHARQIIHRDLKPANIILTNSGANETIKLVDFGIAKQLERTDQKLTKTGTIVGTPAFMSPEACRCEQIDSRTDIYSLGCVFYTALTGKLPVEGDSAYEVMYKHLSARVPVLDIEDNDLSAIIEKCTEPLPENRFQTATELLQALQSQKFVHDNTQKINRNANGARNAGLVIALFAAIIGWGWSNIGVINSAVLNGSRPALDQRQRAEAALQELKQYTDSHRDVTPQIAEQIEQYNHIWNSKQHKDIAACYGLSSNIESTRLREYQIKHLKTAIAMIHLKPGARNPYKEMVYLGKIYLKTGQYDNAAKVVKQELDWQIKNNRKDVLRYQLELVGIALIRKDWNLYKQAMKGLGNSSTSAKILTATKTFAYPDDPRKDPPDAIIVAALEIDPDFPFVKTMK